MPPVSRILSCAALCAACAACATPLPFGSVVQQPTSARPELPTAPPAAEGAIYRTGYTAPLFEDRRARRVGDVLIVNINENTAAKKDANSNASRKGSFEASVTALNRLPGKSFLGLNGAAASDSSFEGKGATGANNAFTGVITTTVTEVLPNGNLRVAGEKQLGINQGAEFIRISGVVNPASVVGNTVSSIQVADARIEYRANGYIDEAQTMGWLQRFFLTVLPF